MYVLQNLFLDCWSDSDQMLDNFTYGTAICWELVSFTFVILLVSQTSVNWAFWNTSRLFLKDFNDWSKGIWRNPYKRSNYIAICMHMHSKFGKTEEPFLLGSLSTKTISYAFKPLFKVEKTFLMQNLYFLIDGLRKCQIKVTLY